MMCVLRVETDQNGSAHVVLCRASKHKNAVCVFLYCGCGAFWFAFGMSVFLLLSMGSPIARHRTSDVN